MKTTPVASPLVDALENAWAAIQTNFEDVPDVVVTLGSGRVTGGMKLGHFAASSWTKAADGTPIHELFIGAEGLQRGSKAVMATLLHEAAHAYAEATGVKDTSREGRYHNDKFRLIGETFGLKLSRDPRIGWSITELTEDAAKEYEDAIMVLDLALTAYRAGLPVAAVAGTGSAAGPSVPVAPAKKRARNGLKVSCGCRSFNISKAAWNIGSIGCGVCGNEFEEVED